MAVRLGSERFGRDAARHLGAALGVLAAVPVAGGTAAGVLLGLAGRSLGHARAALAVGGLYGGHAASRDGDRVRTSRRPVAS